MTSDPPIRCLLAPNPSPLTGTGTNTWLVGATGLAVIDPGPDDAAHLAAILAAIGPGQWVERIIVTHAHLDHSALAPRLAALTGAPVHAFGPAGQDEQLEVRGHGTSIPRATRRPPTGPTGRSLGGRPGAVPQNRTWGACS